MAGVLSGSEEVITSSSILRSPVSCLFHTPKRICPKAPSIRFASKPDFYKLLLGINRHSLWR